MQPQELLLPPLVRGLSQPPGSLLLGLTQAHHKIASEPKISHLKEGQCKAPLASAASPSDAMNIFHDSMRHIEVNHKTKVPEVVTTPEQRSANKKV